MTFSRAEQDARRRDVARLIRRGESEREIARHLGVHHVTVCRDVAALKAAWRDERRRDVGEWIEAELAKLQAIEGGLWARVDAGDLHATDRLLAVMDRRARLLGLDAPTKIDLGARVKAKAEELARAHDLSLDDVLAEMQAILDGPV